MKNIYEENYTYIKNHVSNITRKLKIMDKDMYKSMKDDTYNAKCELYDLIAKFHIMDEEMDDKYIDIYEQVMKLDGMVTNINEIWKIYTSGLISIDNIKILETEIAKTCRFIINKC